MRGEGGGTVVDVEQHRVEAPPARAQRGGDVADLDLDALSFSGWPASGPERPAVPLDHRRHQLGDDDGGVRRQHVERRAQREAHAEAADQHARLVAQRAPRAQPNAASASSEPCMRLDISGLPLARITYSLP